GADQLRRVTQAATVDLLTGAGDHLLRTMTVDIRLAAHVPDRVKASLGQLAAAHIRFDLAIGRPNSPVRVAEPQGALPPSAIPRRRPPPQSRRATGGRRGRRRRPWSLRGGHGRTPRRGRAPRLARRPGP